MTTQLRPAAVAGMFYPASPPALLAEVDAFLAGARPPASDGPPKALIVPHAGYRYSGPVAGRAYAAIAPFADRIRRVVLIGPAHRVYVDGLALPGTRAFDTPLGPVSVDVDALALIPDVPAMPLAHAREHSLEVQLPFLVRVLPRFSIVPMVAGEATGLEVAAVLEALWGGPETLLVISSDLSHYLPYGEARAIDEETARRIVDLGPTITHVQACGATPVNGLLVVAARRGLRPELLDLRSSGDTAGGRDQVVGYGAFAFHEEAGHGA